MKPPKGPFNSMVCDQIVPFQPSSKGNTYTLLHLLTNYPIAIPIPYKTDEVVAHTCLQHVYATVGGSLNIITDSGKELKNDLFQKVASE